jgi:hypothetical protein
MTNNFDLGRVALNVARVFRPEAFVLPTSRFERRPKILTSKEVSYIYPTPNRSCVTRHLTLAGPKAGRAAKRVPASLIETPKRLEIAVTQTKQEMEALSNRDRIAPPSQTYLPGILRIKHAGISKKEALRLG